MELLETISTPANLFTKILKLFLKMEEMRFVYDVSDSGCGEYDSTAVPVTNYTDQTLNNSIMSLLSTEFDTTDVDKPHAYLVWMFYDQNMNLDVANSGAAKVQNPNSLETLLRNDLNVSKDGYLHTYVSNGSEAKVNFDNFLVQYQRGQLRQINDYYPYGLTIAGINSNSDEYLNKYTSKELQTGEFDASLSTGLEMFDFGSRFYDPQLGVWFTPDPAEQFHNPYLGIGNNPVMYVDPDGELAWFIPVIAGAVFGGVNLGIQASNGEINNFGDGLKAFGSGFVAGATIATGVGLGLGVPVLGTVIKAAGYTYLGTTGLGILFGLGDGVTQNDWSTLENTGKLFAGNFYLDENRDFFGQVWQGTSRFSLELLQTTVGHGYSQFRNKAGLIDRVDYFAGATFATSENRNQQMTLYNGLSLGNFININIDDRIQGSFKERVVGNPEKDIPADPLFMHEYGHTFDSQLFGPLYLPVIGPISASGNRYTWTEIRANVFAERYFRKRFGIDWSVFENRFPLSR